jgi:hypothetical protein
VETTEVFKGIVINAMMQVDILENYFIMFFNIFYRKLIFNIIFFLFTLTNKEKVYFENIPLLKYDFDTNDMYTKTFFIITFI